jgi:WD40 repeat protein
MLCSGSDDKTVRCWNVNTLNCQAIISDFKSPILDLAFSKNDHYLVCSEDDGNVKL